MTLVRGACGSAWRKAGGSAGRGALPLLLVAALAAALLGCSGGATAGDEERARAMMRMVGIEYGRFLASHNGQPPKDEAELRQFIDAQISQTPNYGVKNAEELLTSPRDGQPLKIIVGKKVAPPDPSGSPWAAYEQTGVGGSRLAVNARGQVQELSSEQIESVVAK
ncbi:MAG: hypothetical protein DCC67_00865 [Planctomycetota bacterium]|nr:MAG: hypothetical protein DCC67_00865 [Planctomycetota bacterium]